MRRPFHLDNIELLTARLVGQGMAGVVVREGQEGVNAVGFDYELRDDHGDGHAERSS